MFTKSSQFYSPEFRDKVVALVSDMRHDITEEDAKNAGYDFLSGKRFNSDDHVFQSVCMEIEGRWTKHNKDRRFTAKDARNEEFILMSDDQAFANIVRLGLFNAADTDSWYAVDKDYGDDK